MVGTLRFAHPTISILVIASEAKQSRISPQSLDCFVASLLAMTGGSGQLFRNLAVAPAPKAGIWLTAMTTAKVISSMAMPSTEITARSPLSLRS